MSNVSRVKRAIQEREWYPDAELRRLRRVHEKRVRAGRNPMPTLEAIRERKRELAG